MVECMFCLQYIGNLKRGDVVLSEGGKTFKITESPVFTNKTHVRVSTDRKLEDVGGGKSTDIVGHRHNIVTIFKARNY